MVNEELTAGRTPGLRARLSRGHLRHVRDHDQRLGARPIARRRRPASSTCGLPRRGHVVIEPWRAPAFPDRQGPRRQSRRARSHHPVGWLHLRATGSAPDANEIQVAKQDADARWTRRRASAAGRASRRARTASASLFSGAKIAHLGQLPQGQPERSAGRLAMVGADGPRGLRRLHPPRRMPGGVPEGDQHRRHLADEPRLPACRRDKAHRADRRGRRRLTAGLAPLGARLPALARGVADGGTPTRRAQLSPRIGTRIPRRRSAGADAVEKTTYVSGKGTEPEAQHKRRARRPRACPPAPGHGATWAIIGVPRRHGRAGVSARLRTR